jgi:predicted transcriptional regulator
MSEPVRPLPDPDDDTAARRAAVEQGLADAKAGRTIPYEDVRRWLLSWGTEAELPPLECP